MNELEYAFKFSDAILRHLIIRMEGPVTEPSPMLQQKEKADAAADLSGEAEEPSGETALAERGEVTADEAIEGAEADSPTA